MDKKDAIRLFEQQQVRAHWDNDLEKWLFSITDVIQILTQSDRPRKYWSDLKRKLTKEGSELSEKIGQLKVQSQDGKYYKTDVADTEQLFRLIQSIPSTKAEPFKIWIAQVARERIDEIEDPEKGTQWATNQLLLLRYEGISKVDTLRCRDSMNYPEFRYFDIFKNDTLVQRFNDPDNYVEQP